MFCEYEVATDKVWFGDSECNCAQLAFGEKTLSRKLLELIKDRKGRKEKKNQKLQ